MPGPEAPSAFPCRRSSGLTGTESTGRRARAPTVCAERTLAAPGPSRRRRATRSGRSRRPDASTAWRDARCFRAATDRWERAAIRERPGPRRRRFAPRRGGAARPVRCSSAGRRSRWRRRRPPAARRGPRPGRRRRGSEAGSPPRRRCSPRPRTHRGAPGGTSCRGPFAPWSGCACPACPPRTPPRRRRARTQVDKARRAGSTKLRDQALKPSASFRGSKRQVLSRRDDAGPCRDRRSYVIFGANEAQIGSWSGGSAGSSGAG